MVYVLCNLSFDIYLSIDFLGYPIISSDFWRKNMSESCVWKKIVSQNSSLFHLRAAGTYRGKWLGGNWPLRFWQIYKQKQWPFTSYCSAPRFSDLPSSLPVVSLSSFITHNFLQKYANVWAIWRSLYFLRPVFKVRT